MAKTNKITVRLTEENVDMINYLKSELNDISVPELIRILLEVASDRMIQAKRNQ